VDGTPAEEMINNRPTLAVAPVEPKKLKGGKILPVKRIKKIMAEQEFQYLSTITTIYLSLR
jgi:hypothetical protein